ncbi:caspase family protein [Bradyrhizobium tropiciagri]|uniref:caspase family protein n=1 Tax=Bradyrhizobium tropiciagri TaxID=312253 RepID=UPI000ACC0960|nr:caspase family protein [Bradyrhizobium tropiciagri]
MGQKRGRRRSLTTKSWLLGGVLIASILTPLPAMADAPPTGDVPLCKDVMGQEATVPDIKKMIEAAPGGSARRLAIVVGNDYPDRQQPNGALGRSIYAVPKLTNAIKDATAIAALMLKLKFKVACFLNVSAKFHDRVITASTTVRDSINALTFYYFAGHGYAMGAESFSVGDGAEDDSRESLRQGSLSQSSILAGLSSRGAPVIAILDMCRSQLSIVDADGRRAVNEKPLDGYLPISKVPGLLVHYSTSPNDYAADLPAQPNGLYAKVFLDQTPSQPGVSAEQLLNDFVGKKLADGLQIDGKIYQQFPNLVAYPDDWRKIQIFDGATASNLDSVMGAVIALEAMVESGPAAVAIACRMAIQLRDDWKAAADPAGAQTTVAQLEQRIEKLLQTMKDKGSPCPDILSLKEASAPITLPPLAHIAKTSIPISAAGSPPNYVGEDHAKPGTWLTTNSVALPIDVTQAGTFATISKFPIQLDSGFVSSSKVQKPVSKSDIYFTPIDGDTAKLVDTKDQVVVRFRPGAAEIIEPAKLVSAIKKTLKPTTKLVFILLPTNDAREKNYLDHLRLGSLRMLRVVAALAKAGVTYGQIVTPASDQAPIEVATLQADEALIKVVGSSPLSFEGFTIESLSPARVTGGTKQKLDLYEGTTKFLKE